MHLQDLTEVFVKHNVHDKLGVHLTRNDLTGQTIIATGLDRREIVLFSLTPSELTSSIADLAAQLLHVVQLQNPPPASTPTVPIDNPSAQDDNRSESWTDNSTDSHMPTSTARRCDLTYSSALLDVSNISGCSVPT